MPFFKMLLSILPVQGLQAFVEEKIACDKG